MEDFVVSSVGGFGKKEYGIWYIEPNFIFYFYFILFVFYISCESFVFSTSLCCFIPFLCCVALRCVACDGDVGRELLLAHLLLLEDIF